MSVVLFKNQCPPCAAAADCALHWRVENTHNIARVRLRLYTGASWRIYTNGAWHEREPFFDQYFAVGEGVNETGWPRSIAVSQADWGPCQTIVVRSTVSIPEDLIDPYSFPAPDWWPTPGITLYRAAQVFIYFKFDTGSADGNLSISWTEHPAGEENRYQVFSAQYVCPPTEAEP